VQIGEYLGYLGEHAPALATAAEATGLAGDVPTCPGWTVADLVGHIGSVHRWAIAILQAEPGSGRIAMPSAPETGLLDWYRAGVFQLADVLTNVPDDVAAWTFLPAPTPKAFWARRQAHETAMHRADAEAAGGGQISFPVDFAVDGIDELLNGFLARPRTMLVADPPVSVLIAPSDAATWWHMSINLDGRVTRMAGSQAADVTVSGPASELYLYLWNRGAGESVDVVGDDRVTALWRELARV
jgi:uncharacterized protein (TIGR03083 family)